MMRRKFWTGLVVGGLGLWLAEHWVRRVGADADEAARPLPGDERIEYAAVQTTHAITIHTTPAAIWPWLMQAGYHRGGWYTDARWYAWVERQLWHTTSPTVDHLLPGYGELQVGDVVPDGPPGTAFFTVAAVEPQESLVLYSTTHVRMAFPAAWRANGHLHLDDGFTWTFVLEPIEDGVTRLIVRTRAAYGPWWLRVFATPLLVAADAVMARMMLQGIKRRVERPTAPLMAHPATVSA